MKYKIKQIYRNIFLILFKDQFDLSMTFFRYQEYYESPHKEIYRNNKLSFKNLIKIYSKYQKHKHFSYFNDWKGFNIPSFVLNNLCFKQKEPMFYDNIMNKIYTKIRNIQGKYKKKKQEPFYLIGMLEENQNTTLNHELSHALYWLRVSYKDFVDAEVGKLSKRVYRALRKELEISYNASVVDDEIIAYIISRFS